ncbi:Group II intron-encoded protein ltrA [Nitrincola nitratireducens]|uniref:Group II intron-encoded protein ltrA n=1 Tax=Nitrincola nitratireducens TaxID=1229521 RepID=W9USL0_9GAMM|nr:Group II intron-encoded protein ltrA [Nitrincola nitratireducens]
MMIDDAQAQETAAMARGSEQNSPVLRYGAEIDAAASGRTKTEVPLTMDAVITRENLMLAYQRVVENKGAAGIDNLSVSELKPWLKAHWPSVRAALIAGRYLPRRIRKVDIPKPNGGIRTLGIPTVVDRLIQQAIAQVLTLKVEPGFSISSYGFRPHRNAWQAVRQAQQYIQSGKRWAYEHLARLGGWKDTKRTGRASVKVLWEGWFKLQTILEGYDLARALEADL